MRKRLPLLAFALSAVIALICLALAFWPRGRKPPEAVPLRPVSAAALSPDPPRGPIAINSADSAALESLPGIGPHLARLILEARARSPFFYPEDIKSVPGIGDRRLQQILPYINLD